MMTASVDAGVTAVAIVALLAAKELLDVFRGKRADSHRRSQMSEISSSLTGLKQNVDGLRGEITDCLHLIVGADNQSGMRRDQERLEGRLDEMERRERVRLEAEAAGLHTHRRREDDREIRG